MRYRSVLVGLTVGIVVGVLVGRWLRLESLTESQGVGYQEADPATAPLRLDSLTLKREAGMTPQIRYEVVLSRDGTLTYRGASGSFESALSPHPVVGNTGTFTGQMSPLEVRELTSLAVWPQQPSDVALVPPMDSPYAQLTLYFSKVLLGEGRPEFLNAVETTLKSVEWRPQEQ